MLKVANGIEKSNLPVKTAEVNKTILEASKSKTEDKSTFDVLSNLEFLAEGSAIKDLEEPDRVLIGGETKTQYMHLLMYIKNGSLKKKSFINIWSSELAKLTANALAQRISSINSIGAILKRQLIKKWLER